MVDAWRVLPAGHVEDHPFGDIPSIGLVGGVPFTFARETLDCGGSLLGVLDGGLRAGRGRRNSL